MFRMLLGSNGTLLRSIITKWSVKMLRKYGLNAKINCGDFTVFREGEELLIHVNAEVRVNEQELFQFINDKLDG